MDVFTAFQQSPLFFVGTCFILGLLIGSFLNVVIYRVPVMLENSWRRESQEFLAQDGSPTASGDGNDEPAAAEQSTAEVFNLVFPHSHCPQCGAPVRAWQNIPVISYILLAGKCGSCKAPISLRYPSVELVTGLLSGIVAWHFGPSFLAFAALVLTWCLVSLAMIDFDHQLLPDDITLPLIWVGLLVNSFGGFTTLDNAVWGGVLGYGGLWSIFWIFKLLTGKDGMGYGDFKLLAALGAWFGWQALPIIILLSSLVGAVVGVAMILLLGRDRQIPIPFGPYLAGAGWIAMLWGEDIKLAYFSLAGI